MKVAPLLACPILTAGIQSSCEREPSIPEKITAIYSALNEEDQEIKRLKNQTETLESRVGALENKMGNLETTMRNLESNTDTSSVTYLERRVAELERKMHVLTTTDR